MKRFVSRKFEVRATKRENLRDLYELLKWNHQYDANNLQQALESLCEFEDKIISVVIPLISSRMWDGTCLIDTVHTA